MIDLGKNSYIGDADYHRDREYISSSGLKTILKDPRKFYEVYVKNVRQVVPPRLQEAFDFGTYLHSLVCEPDTVIDKYSVGEVSDGKDFISTEHADLAVKLLDALSETKQRISIPEYSDSIELADLFNGGEAECTFAQIVDGVKIKVRCDYRRQFDTFGIIQDVKTTSQPIGTDHAINKIVKSLDYELSAALYKDVVDMATGIEHDFYWIWFSKKSLEVRMTAMTPEQYQRGRSMYKAAISKLKEARRTGIYYQEFVTEIN